MTYELTDQEAEIIIDALRYQYDGCGDVDEGLDEENNRIASKIQDTLKKSAQGASVGAIPFPDFALPLIGTRPTLSHGHYDATTMTPAHHPDDSWDWTLNTGLPFDYVLTYAMGPDGRLRWFVWSGLGKKEVASLKEMLMCYRDLALPVLKKNPDDLLPRAWKQLLIEHDLL